MCGRIHVSRRSLERVQYWMNRINNAMQHPVCPAPHESEVGNVNLNSNVTDKSANSEIALCNNGSPGMSCTVLHNPITAHSGQKNSAVPVVESTSMIWGLVPSYTKLGPSEKPNHYRIFNKRTDSLESSHFLKLLLNNRCIVVVDGFFEWKVIGGKKNPHFVKLNEPMQLAALYDVIYDINTNEELITFTILTCNASIKLSKLHNRQPVNCNDEEVLMWLNRETSKTNLFSMLQTFERNIQTDKDFYINEQLIFYPVNPKVTDPSYQGDDCIKQYDFGHNHAMKFFTVPSSPNSSIPSEITSHAPEIKKDLKLVIPTIFKTGLDIKPSRLPKRLIEFDFTSEGDQKDRNVSEIETKSQTNNPFDEKPYSSIIKSPSAKKMRSPIKETKPSNKITDYFH